MTQPTMLSRRITWLFRRPARFVLQAGGIALRPYQSAALEAAVHSIRSHLGLSFVWVFPRQSGKDETLAALVQYLLTIYQEKGGEIVFFNPTFSPQSLTSIRRLESHLQTNLFTRGRWRSRFGHTYRLGAASCTFLSADPAAHVVSATASLLLVVNEAQDVAPLKYDREAAPMAASTNATRIFSGTRWTGDTLLEREYLLALEAQRQDGIQRVFLHTADDVRTVVPAYGAHVDGVIASLGRDHPVVRTQYFSQTIDARAGMFPPGRLALMVGSHPPLLEPRPGRLYCFLIDVAGQEERNMELLDGSTASPALHINTERDSTTLKLVELDFGSMELTGRPTYNVVFRRSWLGQKHVDVYSAIASLVRAWHPFKIVIDATGLGEGLWSLLDNAFGADVVLPVKFTSQVKSDLGYGFLAIIESGRFHEYHPFDSSFRLSLRKCVSDILPGPAHLMRWGVPDGVRDPVSRLPVHDDDIMASALCVLLDHLAWSISSPTTIIPAPDPLSLMDRNF